MTLRRQRSGVIRDQCVNNGRKKPRSCRFCRRQHPPNTDYHRSPSWRDCHRPHAGSVQARWYLFAVGYFAAIRPGVAVMQRTVIGEWPTFNPEPWFVMVAAVPHLAAIEEGGQGPVA